MKHIVRAFVIALVLTGAIASTHASASSTQAVASLSKMSAMPIPSCPPDDPNACGISQTGGGSSLTK